MFVTSGRAARVLGFPCRSAIFCPRSDAEARVVFTDPDAIYGWWPTAELEVTPLGPLERCWYHGY